MEIRVPGKPIDRYTLSYWRLSISESWVYIKEVSSTYYVNTLYEEIDPSCSRGAPLVDQWMVSVNGSPSGRIVGWKEIEKGYPDMFATKDEAIQEAKKRFNRMIAAKKEDIKRIEKLIDKEN